MIKAFLDRRSNLIDLSGQIRGKQEGTSYRSASKERPLSICSEATVIPVWKTPVCKRGACKQGILKHPVFNVVNFRDSGLNPFLTQLIKVILL